uniref:Selenoprotein K n=1 Tax=Cavia porcellus TaxID=10141 RepID=A0A286XSH1_CAVPO
VYNSNGLSLITDFFWGIAEFVVLFFKTLFQQDVKKGKGYKNSSNSRYDDGRGPPGNPPQRMGQINLFMVPVLLQWLVDKEGKCLL